MAIEKRKFGNTGHKSSAVIFGAAALWNETQSTSDRVLDLLFKYDINHIDVANIYGNAELRIGPWMKNYRKNFFLATKTYERTYKGAKESRCILEEYMYLPKDFKKRIITLHDNCKLKRSCNE